MAKTQDYRIDWTKRVVTMTKRFADKANVYGSTAYDIVKGFRMDGFKVEVRKTEKRKSCPTRVTFKQMEQLLSCMTDPDERLAELHAIMDVAKAQKNRYEYVRQWFLLNYPNFREYQAMDANYRIVAPKLHLLPEAKDEKTA